MAITINNIVPQTEEVFDPNGNSLGFLNEYQLYDLRVQIMKEKVEGYYVMFNGEKIAINSYGRFEVYPPDGFFDFIDNKVDELIGLK